MEDLFDYILLTIFVGICLSRLSTETTTNKDVNECLKLNAKIEDIVIGVKDYNLNRKFKVVEVKNSNIRVIPEFPTEYEKDEISYDDSVRVMCNEVRKEIK